MNYLKGNRNQPITTMRKCVLLFLLFVFVLFLAAISENKEREAAIQKVAAEEQLQDPLLDETTALNTERK
jgi:hypothetical protein